MFHGILIKNIECNYIIFRFFAKRKTPFGVSLKVWNIQTIECKTCLGATPNKLRIMLALKSHPVMSSPRTVSMMKFPPFRNRSFWARRNCRCSPNFFSKACNPSSATRLSGKACTYIFVAVIWTAFSRPKLATAGFAILLSIS